MWRELPDFRAEKEAQNLVKSVAVMFFSVLIVPFPRDLGSGKERDGRSSGSPILV